MASVLESSNTETKPRRAAKSVSLVLIGSSLILAGCGRTDDTAQDTSPSTAPYGHGGGYYRGGHTMYVSRGGRGGEELRGGTTGVGSTVRGGFGASGHAAAGS
jgi:hypothetical protein